MDDKKLNQLIKFFSVSDTYINMTKDGKNNLRKLIGNELIKKRGKYWYFGIIELKRMNYEEIDEVILKIQSNIKNEHIFS